MSTSPQRTKTNRPKTDNKKRSAKAALPRLEPFITNDAPGGAQTGVRVGFPANRRVKLSYAQHATLGSDLGVQAKSQFRLNGAFDPWYSSVGHQPMGFDQWSAYYNHYVVLGCKWTVTYAPWSGSTGPALFGVSYSDDITIPTDVETLVEGGAQITVHAAATVPHIFRGDVKIADFFNREGDISNDETLRAVVTADPTEVCFLNLFAFSQSSGSLSADYLLELEYDIKFFEPKDLGPSLKLIKKTPSALVPGTKASQTNAKLGSDEPPPRHDQLSPTTRIDSDGCEWFRV